MKSEISIQFIIYFTFKQIKHTQKRRYCTSSQDYKSFITSFSSILSFVGQQFTFAIVKKVFLNAKSEKYESNWLEYFFLRVVSSIIFHIPCFQFYTANVDPTSGDSFTLTNPDWFSANGGGKAGQVLELGYQMSYDGDTEPNIVSLTFNGQDLCTESGVTNSGSATTTEGQTSSSETTTLPPTSTGTPS